MNKQSAITKAGAFFEHGFSKFELEHPTGPISIIAGFQTHLKSPSLKQRSNWRFKAYFKALSIDYLMIQLLLAGFLAASLAHI